MLSTTARIIDAANNVNYWLDSVEDDTLVFINYDERRGFDITFGDSIIIREIDESTYKTVLNHELTGDDRNENAIKLIATF